MFAKHAIHMETPTDTAHMQTQRRTVRHTHTHTPTHKPTHSHTQPHATSIHKDTNRYTNSVSVFLVFWISCISASAAFHCSRALLQIDICISSKTTTCSNFSSCHLHLFVAPKSLLLNFEHFSVCVSFSESILEQVEWLEWLFSYLWCWSKNKKSSLSWSRNCW